MFPDQAYQSSQDNVVAISSTRYSMFRFDPQNRPINEDHLAKLHDSVVRKNLLREFPILVDENFTIIDGQHRLRVAESLGVPIYYIVSSKVSMDDIVMTTDNVSKWENSDYLHRWCAKGKADYLSLKAFWDKYRYHDGKKFLTLNQCLNLCHYGDRIGMNRAFRDGGYVCNDLQYAERVASALIDFSHYVDFYRDSVFVYAVSNLMANSRYDHSRMMSKMKYLSAKMMKCPDMDTYMAVFTKLYNHKLPKRFHVVLEKVNSNEPHWRVDKKKNKQ